MSTTNKPQVTLIHSTPNPLISLLESYRICYNSYDKSDTVFTETGVALGEADEKLLKRCIMLKHHGPLEFVDFKFEISGISKVADRQLVRHRIASYSAMSGRRVKIDKYMVPPAILENSRAQDIFETFLQHCTQTMDQLNDLGIKMEDVRYLTPMATTSTFHVKFNLRSLRNFLSERMCKDAQWEIREIARQIKNILMKIHPILLFKFEKHYDCQLKCGECLK